MSAYVVQPHKSQYAAGSSLITRSSGCTWTSAANGAANASNGATSPTPDQVHAKVRRHEETNPTTPGWSLPDVKLAMTRMGVGFKDLSGSGWGELEDYRANGYGILLQGDSDRFNDATCSGAFNGDHAIYVHPQTNAAGAWLIGDPICKTWRFESKAIVKAYAVKLAATIRFGVFTTKVPLAQEEDMFHTKPGGALIGTAEFVTPGHYLLSTSDPKGKRYGPRPVGEKFSVSAALDLVDPKGVPIDIDGHQPPKNNRDEVYLVDGKNAKGEPFGAQAFVLRADVDFEAIVVTVPDPDCVPRDEVDALIAADRATATVAVVYPE